MKSFAYKPLSSFTYVAYGFTLVETLVAVSILLVAIVGPMTIVQKSLQLGYYANDRVTAVYLAQEGIESVIRLRDNQANKVLGNLNGSEKPWDWFSSNSLDNCKTPNGCDINIESGSYRDCGSGGANCRLKVSDDEDYVYGYTGSNQSPFTRVIKVESAQGNKATKVVVTVSWATELFKDVSPERSIVLETYIYDIYGHYKP